MSYTPPPLSLQSPRIITPFSQESIGTLAAGMADTANASIAWSPANTAVFVPFSLWKPRTAKKMFVYNGATASGNFDIGVYNDSGTRLVSSGSTAQSGTDTVQEVDITDTALPAGQLLWLALAFDNTTATVNGKAHGAAAATVRGLMTMGSAFPLPSSATLATPSGLCRLAIFGVAFETDY